MKLWLLFVGALLVGCHPPPAAEPRVPRPEPVEPELESTEPVPEPESPEPESPESEPESPEPEPESSEPEPEPEPEYRPFVPPEPRVLEAPTRASDLPRDPELRCRDLPYEAVQHERERELAALDAALRRRGAMLLQPIARRVNGRRGMVIRGPAGERFMIVAHRNTCGPLSPVAIDDRGEVFVVHPTPRARQTRRIRVCRACEGGCGRAPESDLVLVEVPDGAHLGDPRMVEFPMDVEVTFDSIARCDRRVP